MKKFIAAALFTAVIAAPAVADDAAAKAATSKVTKSAPAKPVQNKHGHKMKMHDSKMSGMKDDCEQEHHGMKGHHESDMMGELGDESMMMPHMDMLATMKLEGEQRSKIAKVFDKLKHDNWLSMGLINDETVKLRDLYDAEKHDAAAIGKVYQAIFDLKRQMIEASIEAENRVDEILTPEQRAQMKEDCHGTPAVHEHHMHGHPMH